MLTAANLRKIFSTVVAVDDVSLSVERGQILGLIGPNGAGKTTTIRLILNIIRPDAGTILFDGVPFCESVANRTGYLPEERGLYRKSKLINTLVYLGTLKGMLPAEARRTALRWLERFELSQYADRKTEELSKGNQQKIQFTAAVMHDPKFVVLDEPFSGLDPVNQILLKEILMELRQQGKAIIFSTHVMEQAERLCERITLINKGKVVVDGSLAAVKKQYGRNTVRIEFDGDGSFLSTVSGVRSALVYENYAELDMGDGVGAAELLKMLVQRLSIRKFELVEPSLHSIFLDKVGGAPEGAGPQSAQGGVA
jgi:ABC-2 type transport system ATP-binding protein